MGAKNRGKEMHSVSAPFPLRMANGEGVRNGHSKIWSRSAEAKTARSRLIFNEHQRIADWCEARIEHFSGWGSDPKAIGYEVEGVIKGGVVYTNYTPANVFASIALDAPITKRFLYAIFYNPFMQWKVRHMSCAIEESNVRSIRLCSHMGFIPEGRLRESAINGEDVILMGMLSTECRFL